MKMIRCFLVFLFCLPSLLVAQECRFLSFDRSGAITFQTSGTNLYVGFQFTSNLADTNGWINALEPYWNILMTNSTMTVYVPPKKSSGESRFLRLVCSTNPLPPTPVANEYEVYGGESFSTDEPDWFDKGYDPPAYGCTFIGSATNTTTFTGAYNVYIIHTAPYNVARVDTVRGSSGTYYNTSITGNTSDWQNIGGVEDGLFAEVGITHLDRGGFVVIDATGDSLVSLTVYIIQ